jgi:hypothetical protein
MITVSSGEIAAVWSPLQDHHATKEHITGYWKRKNSETVTGYRYHQHIARIGNFADVGKVASPCMRIWF